MYMYVHLIKKPHRFTHVHVCIHDAYVQYYNKILYMYMYQFLIYMYMYICIYQHSCIHVLVHLHT